MTSPQFHSITNINHAQSKISDESVISSVYGSDEKNWGDLPAFQGDFINFGFWRDIDFKNKDISVETRILSSKKLYDYAFEISSLREDFTYDNHSLLEIGCGRGVGLAIIFLKHHFKNLKTIMGLDITLDQLTRAVKIHERVFHEPYPFKLIHATADNTTCDAQSIDHAFSIEVAQHFKSFIPFATEMKRILKPTGQLVFVAHLATNKKSFSKLRESSLLVDNKEIDVLCPVDEAIDAFKSLNFNVNCSPIGHHVFPGFDKWIKQVEKGSRAESSKIYEAYDKGYINYYAFVIDAM